MAPDNSVAFSLLPMGAELYVSGLSMTEPHLSFYSLVSGFCTITVQTAPVVMVPCCLTSNLLGFVLTSTYFN